MVIDTWRVSVGLPGLTCAWAREAAAGFGSFWTEKEAGR